MISRDLARRRALLAAARTLRDQLAVGQIWVSNTDPDGDGYDGDPMTDAESMVQVDEIERLAQELERRSGLATLGVIRVRGRIQVKP